MQNTGNLHCRGGHHPKIKLNQSNVCNIKFPNGDSHIALIDSGSTRSIVSSGLINKIPYLNGLQKHLLNEPLKLMVGDGNYVSTISYIEPKIILENNILPVKLYVVPNFTEYAVILGADTQKQYEILLDAKTNEITLRKPFYPIKIQKKTVVFPGKSKTVKVYSPLPFSHKNCSFLVTTEAKFQKYIPKKTSCKFTRGQTKIRIRNPTTRAITFRPETLLASVHIDVNSNYANADFSNPIIDLGPDAIPDTDHEVIDQTNMPPEELFAYKKGLYPYLDDDDIRLQRTDEQLIKEQLKLTNTKLSKEGIDKLYKILQKNSKALSLHDNIGKVHRYLVKFEPDFPDKHEGFHAKAYIHSQKDKEFAKKEIDKLIKMGVFSQGIASHTSSMFLVKRPGKSPRIVADLRRCNQMFRNVNKSNHTLRTFCEAFGRKKNVMCTTFDLKSAFHSVQLTEDSKKYVGLHAYQNSKSLVYDRLPMGHRQSPACFVQLLHYILQELPPDTYNNHLIPYFDDLLIFNEDEKSHLETIDAVLSILAKHGFTISLAKAQVAPKDGIKFLGYFIDLQSPNGPKLRVLKSRIEDINKLAIPQSKRDVKRILGTAQFIAQHIPDFHKLALPLYDLLKKSAKFEWKNVHDNAWNEIKNRLKNPPALSFPSSRPEDFYIVETDCSRRAMGAVLKQMQTNNDESRSEHVIAYFSKNLSKMATHSYSVLELETLGLYCALVSFQSFLHGQAFFVRTDHKALEHLMKSSCPPPTVRLQKFMWKLSAFQFDIQYVKPGQIAFADLLSRHPSPVTEDPHTIIPIGISDKELHERDGHEGMHHSLVTTRAQAKRMVESKRSTKLPPPPKPPPPKPVKPQKNPGPPPKQAAVESRSCIEKTSFSQSPITISKIPAKTEPAQGRKTIRDFPFHSMKFPQEAMKYEPSPTITTPQELTTNVPLWSEDFPIPKMLTKMPRQSELDMALAKHVWSKYKTIPLPYTRKQMSEAQKNDSYFGPIFKFLKFGQIPNNSKKAKSIIALSEFYVLVDDVLFYLRNSTAKRKDQEHDAVLAIPKEFIFAILHHYHSSHRGCHLKTTKLYLTLRSKYFIPNLHDHILNFVRACHVCNQIAPEKNAHLNREWQPRLISDFIPLSHLHIDLKTVPKSRSEYRYILVAVCEVTRYCITAALRTRSAEEVAEAIVTKICLPYRTPATLTLDFDGAFKNKLMETVARLLNVNLHFIHPGAHETSKAERFIQSISNLLLSKIGNDFESWPKLLPFACKAYNNSKISGWDYSPSYLVFLHEDRNFIDVAKSPFEEICSSQEEYLNLLKKRFETVKEVALKTHNNLQIRQCNEHNVRHSHKFKKFAEGELVYLLAPTSSALLKSEKIKYNYIGILYIKDVISPNEYILATIQNEILVGSFHLNRLKKATVLLPDNSYASTIEEVRKAINQGLVSQDISSTIDLQSKRQNDTAFILKDKAAKEVLQTNEQKLPTYLYVQEKVNSPHLNIYMKVAKVRWINGKPQLLCQKQNKNGHIQMSIWVNPELHPILLDVMPKLLTNKRIPQVGSLAKYIKRIYY